MKVAHRVVHFLIRPIYPADLKTPVLCCVLSLVAHCILPNSIGRF